MHGKEAGEISRKSIETRALELARIDGRDMWNKGDLQAATEELGGSWHPDTEPELVVPELAELVTWDEPVTSEGQAIPRTPLENEANVGEILIQEGLEEADHDRRVAVEEDDDDLRDSG